MSNQGFSPRDLNPTQQHALGEQFVNDVILPQYGVKTHLDRPTSTVKEYNHPNSAPSANDLQLPSDGSQIEVDANKQKTKINEANNKFNLHPEQVIADQINNQTNSAWSAGTNLAKDVKKLIIPDDKK